MRFRLFASASFLIFVTALLAACGGTAAASMKVPVGTSPVRGPADAWVTLIEFADFECPYCGAEEPIVVDLSNSYGPDLRLVFKHFPLTNLHPHAQGAAVASECAHDQNEFWEMHDTLFANQTALTSTDLAGYAQAIGLNVPTWNACLTTQAPLDTVNADEALGIQAGVQGTPTFAVNGVPMVGAAPEADLRSSIDSALAKAKASGVSSANYYNQVVLGL